MLSEKAKKEIREWTKSLVSVVLIALAIRMLIFEPMKIPTGSMEPTLHGIIARCSICNIEYGGNVYNDFHKKCPRRDGGRLKVIQTGDRILVSKFVYGARIPFTPWRLPGLKKPRRGDVIIFKSPTKPRMNFVKRLIALGGEMVEIRDGDVYIDGELIQDPRIKQWYYYNKGEYGRHGVSYQVPENGLFVMGDNSRESLDSRSWGTAPMKKLVGKAELIIWPPKRIRIIK